jgi:hypothetical protein
MAYYMISGSESSENESSVISLYKLLNRAMELGIKSPLHDDELKDQDVSKEVLTVSTQKEGDRVELLPPTEYVAAPKDDEVEAPNMWSWENIGLYTHYAAVGLQGRIS